MQPIEQKRDLADVARSRQYSGWRALANVKQGESDTVLLSPEYLSFAIALDRLKVLSVSYGNSCRGGGT